jgi:predicted metal-binding protein
MEKLKLGIIICDRYRSCAGGKCFRAFHNREGAFSIYKGIEAEISAFTSCGGCPGGNIEYAPEEMKKNGITHIHFATGFIVGYPPCPYMEYFSTFITEKYGMKVISGTHPIPRKYFIPHTSLHSWETDFWKEAIKEILADEKIRTAYD